METQHDLLIGAILARDFNSLANLVRCGVDINMRDCGGAPLLHRVEGITAGEGSEPISRVGLFSTLLEFGVDLHALDHDGGSILTGPIFDQDLVMLRWLLDHGVDPNRGCGEPWETVYDLAKFDYICEADVGWRHCKVEPTDEDRSDEEAWLRYFDGEARRGGRPGPACLYMLRTYGAMSARELAFAISGNAASAVIWSANGWELA